MMPDLFRVDPGRSAIDRSTVVMEDLTDEVMNVARDLLRFQETGESRHATIANMSLDKLVARAQELKRRVNDVRGGINAALAKR